MSIIRVRYRAISALLLAALSAIVLLSVLSGGAKGGGNSFGFSRIPGMSLVLSGAPGLCSGNKGMVPANYCSWRPPASSVAQGWVLDAAIHKYGAFNAGLRLPLPLSFANKHAGVAEVFDRVMTFRTQREANRLLRNTQYTGAENADYTPLATAAINGGIAGRVNSPANDGMSQYRFNWVSGTSEVDVNVVGAKLTVSEAQAVARLARARTR